MSPRRLFQRPPRSGRGADESGLQPPSLPAAWREASSADRAYAEPLLREALSIRRAALPDGHTRTASTLGALGECLLRLGRHAEAEEPLAEAYASLRENAGSDESVGSDEPLHEALRRLLELYQAQGRETEAERYRAQLAALDGGG